MYVCTDMYVYMYVIQSKNTGPDQGEGRTEKVFRCDSCVHMHIHNTIKNTCLYIPILIVPNLTYVRPLPFSPIQSTKNLGQSCHEIYMYVYMSLYRPNILCMSMCKYIFLN